MRTSKNQQRKLNRRKDGQIRALRAELQKYKDMFAGAVRRADNHERVSSIRFREICKFEKGLLTPDGLHLPKWVNPPCPIYFKVEDQKYDKSSLILMPGQMVQ